MRQEFTGNLDRASPRVNQSCRRCRTGDGCVRSFYGAPRTQKNPGLLGNRGSDDVERLVAVTTAAAIFAGWPAVVARRGAALTGSAVAVAAPFAVAPFSWSAVAIAAAFAMASFAGSAIAIASFAGSAIAVAATVVAVAAFARATILARRRAFAWLRRIHLVQQRLARQFHAVLIVDGDHFHLEHIADLAHVLDAIDIRHIQFADVAKTIAARQNLNEGAEFLDRGNPALVHLADANLFGQRLDLGLGGFGAGRVHV